LNAARADVPEMEYLHTDTYPASKDDFERQVCRDEEGVDRERGGKG